MIEPLRHLSCPFVLLMFYTTIIRIGLYANLFQDLHQSLYLFARQCGCSVPLILMFNIYILLIIFNRA